MYSYLDQMEQEVLHLQHERDLITFPPDIAITILTDRRYSDGRNLLEQINHALKIGDFGITIAEEYIQRLGFNRIEAANSTEYLSTIIEVGRENQKPMLFLIMMDRDGSIPFIARSDRGNRHDEYSTSCSRYVTMIAIANQFVGNLQTGGISDIKHSYPSTTIHRGIQRFVYDAFRNLADPIRFLRSSSIF